MKNISVVILVAGTCLSFNAHAVFFFFIPGSVASKVSDAVTGSEGDHCVGEQAKVGDAIRLTSGSLMTVKSLSGASGRCTDSKFPVRALLEPRTSPPAANASVSPIATDAATEARLDLPDSWEQRPLTDRLKAGRNVLYTTNRTTDSGLLLATVRRSGITDVATYATTTSARVINLLKEATQSPVTKLTINGASAWQVEISGKSTARLPVAGAEGLPIIVLQTVYEGSQEIVILNSWTTAANYKNQKVELQRIANSLTGIASTTTENTSLPDKPTPPDTQNPPEGASNPAQYDVVNKLRVLKSLLDQGLITKDDYETKKQAILNSL